MSDTKWNMSKGEYEYDNVMSKGQVKYEMLTGSLISHTTYT